MTLYRTSRTAEEIFGPLSEDEWVIKNAELVEKAAQAARDLIANQKDLPPDAEKVLRNNLWDLYTE